MWDKSIGHVDIIRLGASAHVGPQCIGEAMCIARSGPGQFDQYVVYGRIAKIVAGPHIVAAHDSALPVDRDDFGVVPAQALACLIVVAGASCTNEQAQVRPPRVFGIAHEVANECERVDSGGWIGTDQDTYRDVASARGNRADRIAQAGEEASVRCRL